MRRESGSTSKAEPQIILILTKGSGLLKLMNSQEAKARRRSAAEPQIKRTADGPRPQRVGRPRRSGVTPAFDCQRARCEPGRFAVQLPTAHRLLNAVLAEVPPERRKGRRVSVSSPRCSLRDALCALCTAIAEIVRKLRLIFGVRPSPAAATSARFEVRDYFHTGSCPTFLRPRTGALRLVAASPRCVLCGL